VQGDGDVTDRPTESPPPRVGQATAPKQDGEVRARWAWAEPAVWTERMLTALDTGVKGGVWFSLMDKVYALRNLQAAFALRKRHKRKGRGRGLDHQRWPNAYFAERGLFFLTTAHAQAAQSPMG